MCVCVGEGRRKIEKDRERETEVVSACVMFVCVRCVRVWLRALCHLCVCVWVPPVRRTHDSLSIPDKFYNYFDNFRPLLQL